MYDLEPKQFVYNRTGILSASTAVNEEIAAQFMRVSDLRRDIVIVDSGKEPEQNTVTVNSETLAWRAVAPLSELTKQVLKPKQFHQVEIVDRQYVVQIHDQIIDDDIRKKNYRDRADYEKQYLGRLRREAKNAAVEILFAEKLGFSDQKFNYMLYAPQISLVLTDFVSKNYVGALMQVVLVFGMMHPLINNLNNRRFLEIKELNKLFNIDTNLSCRITPRPWQEAFYPILPVDKWIKGRRFLAKHGEELITAKT